MSPNNVFNYKIGVVGPTRVGKTSLITAMLGESQDLLAGTPASLKAVGRTAVRVNDQMAELKGSLMAGEFDPGAVSGTETSFEYELALRVGKSELRLAILDYPGGWLDPAYQAASPEAQEEWERCLEWIRESTVLLVPVDAAVAMEITLAHEYVGAVKALQVPQATEVAREWAKARRNAGEAGLLVIVPVKCETYFDDNGGARDHSKKLFDRINQMYSELFDAVRKEAVEPDLIGIQYHPVDTIGCVEIKRTRWTSDQDRGLIFNAHYLVQPPGIPRPMGAGSILTALCRHIAVRERNRDRGFFERFRRWLTGEEKLLAEAFRKLQQTPFGSRVTIIDGK